MTVAMPDHYIVLLKIMAMFCVMTVGWAARRRAYINKAMTQLMSRLVVDVVFPCLVFTQLLRTVDLVTLQASWYVPLLGIGVILLAAPAATVAAMRLLARIGWGLPDATRLTIYLIACMPVAISASIMTDRFGGDNLLSARAIFLSTLCSVFTVPAFYWLVRAGGL